MTRAARRALRLTPWLTAAGVHERRGPSGRVEGAVAYLSGSWRGSTHQDGDLGRAFGDVPSAQQAVDTELRAQGWVLP